MSKILLGFLPWVLYFFLSDPPHVQIGAALALVTFLLVGRDGLAKRRILDGVTLLFFLALLVGSFLGDKTVVSRYAFICSGFVLALTALGSVAMGVPFTLQYARETVAEEYQDSPLFLEVNTILSSVWGLIFAVQTLLSLLYLEHIGSASLMNETLPNLLTLGGVVFTSRFPDWYTNRKLQRGGVAGMEGISPLLVRSFEGGAVAYRTLGDGDTVVMLNGSHMTLHGWDPELLSGLAKDYRLLLLDYPGIGESAWSESHTVEELGNWLEGALDSLEVSKCHLVGYSMGGWLGQVFAGRFPERVKSLVLLATDPGGEHATPGTSEDLEALSDRRGSQMEQARRMMHLLFPEEALREVAPRLRAIFGAASLQPQVEQAVIEWEDRLSERWYEREWSQEGASRLTMPVLICGGGRDRIVPVENSHLLKEILPQAKLLIYPDAGHGLVYSEAEELGETLRVFLNNSHRH